MEAPRLKPLVLLIEDEGLLSRMYAKKLEMDGYEYITAPNGDEGIKQATKKQPDLILCDIMMPEKDGLSVLKELKTKEETNDIPVIMLSNLSKQEYIDEALELGAVSFLVKSQMVPAEVMSKIKEVLTANGKQSMLK
jgi:DNA-binding response OmpR family regulator